MLKIKLITVILISIVSATGVFANSDKEAVNIAVKGLSQKLQGDLAMNKVNLKLGQIENQNISDKKIVISGFATVQNADNISLTFDVVVNPVKAEIVDVKYDIVSSIAVGPASATESFLMKKVMGKIKNDYNTDEIVIAIDDFETVKNIDGNTNYVGVAEIRVGMQWSRIEFDVEGDAKAGTSTDVKYKVVE